MKSLNDAGVIYKSQVRTWHLKWPKKRWNSAIEMSPSLSLFLDAFIIQIYPDSNHFLEDVKYHFYRSMETYLLDCFNLKEGHDFMEIHSNSRSAI